MDSVALVISWRMEKDGRPRLGMHFGQSSPQTASWMQFKVEPDRYIRWLILSAHTGPIKIYQYQCMCWWYRQIWNPFDFKELNAEKGARGDFMIVTTPVWFNASVHWCHLRQWSVLINCRISCLCDIFSLIEVFDYHIWGIRFVCWPMFPIFPP